MKTKVFSIKELTPSQIASICDHTFLNRSESYRRDAILGESPIQLRQKAFYKFLEETTQPYAVCVRPEDVVHTRHFFEKKGEKNIKIVAAIGFPDGGWISTPFKYFEAQVALEEGASEIDMVMNHKALKEGDHAFVLQEIQSITNLVHDKGGKIKVILETSELNKDQIAQACRLATHAGVDFIKTSTGFGSFGAKIDDLIEIRKHFNGGVKISGGVNEQNIHNFLAVFANEKTGKLDLDPTKIRIGVSYLII